MMILNASENYSMILYGCYLKIFKVYPSINYSISRTNNPYFKVVKLTFLIPIKE